MPLSDSYQKFFIIINLIRTIQVKPYHKRFERECLHTLVFLIRFLEVNPYKVLALPHTFAFFPFGFFSVHSLRSKLSFRNSIAGKLMCVHEITNVFFWCFQISGLQNRWVQLIINRICSKTEPCFLGKNCYWTITTRRLSNYLYASLIASFPRPFLLVKEVMKVQFPM